MVHSSNLPVITGICDPSKSRAQHHGSYYIVKNTYPLAARLNLQNL